MKHMFLFLNGNLLLMLNYIIFWKITQFTVLTYMSEYYVNITFIMCAKKGYT